MLDCHSTIVSVFGFFFLEYDSEIFAEYGSFDKFNIEKNFTVMIGNTL